MSNESLKKRQSFFKKATTLGEKTLPGKVSKERYEGLIDDATKPVTLPWSNTRKRFTTDSSDLNYVDTVKNSDGTHSYKPSDVLTPDNHITEEELSWQKNHPFTTDSYEKRIDVYREAYEDTSITNFKADQPNLGERVIAASEELKHTTAYIDATGENKFFSDKIHETLNYSLNFSGVNATVKAEISKDGTSWTEVQSGDIVIVGRYVRLTPTPISTQSGAAEFVQWVHTVSLADESTDPTTHIVTGKMPKSHVDFTASYAINEKFILFQGGSDFTSLGLSYDAPTGYGLQYYDGTGWVSTGNTIPVTNGYVCIRGKNFNYLYSFTGNFTSVSGNMAYLLDYDYDPSTSTSLPAMNDNQFYSTAKDKGLFQDCARLTDVSALIIPFTALQKYCYKNMFKGCGALSKCIASLPATSLPEGCYEAMFSGCAALKTAPTFTGVMNIGIQSCQNMFYTCYSLTTPPDLSSVSATYKNCCNNMFAFCTSLKTAPSFSTACLTLDWSSCEGMYRGCTALETAPDLSHVTILGCAACKQMFEDCSALKTAPSLSSITTLNDDGGTPSYAANCMAMFKGCYNLYTDDNNPAPWFSDSITALPSNACNEMFSGCRSMITPPNMSKIVGTIGDYACHFMFYECTNLYEAASMNITGIGEEGCAYMYYGCSFLTSAKEAFSTADTSALTTVGVRGCRSMFDGCSDLLSAPNMKTITSISTDAFVCMFQNCSKLFGIIYLPQVVFSSSFIPSFNPTVNMFSKAGTIHDSKGEYAYMYYVKGTGRNGWNYFNSGIDSDNWVVKEIDS